MMTTDERLAYMAEQIYRNFAAQGRDAAVTATTEHLILYWDPRMKAHAVAMLADPAMRLSDDVRAVFENLRVEAGAG